MTKVTARVVSYGVEREISFTMRLRADLFESIDQISRYGVRVSHKIEWVELRVL